MNSKDSQKRKTRLLVGAGTLSALLIGTFMAFGGPSAINAISAAGNIDTVSTVEDVQAENESLRAAVEALQANETLYQEQIESANGIIEQLQADLGSTETSYDGVLTEYDESLAALQAQNADLVSRLGELSTRDAGYSADLETANTLLTQKSAEIEAMQAREAEFVTAIESASGSVTLLQTELNNSQQQLVNLNAQYVDLQNLVGIMQQRELEYQAQINSINNQQAAANTGGGGGYEGEEGDEYDEDEYGEHEHEYEEEEEDDD